MWTRNTNMKNENMKLQFKACEYMEKTYGKDWEKKNLNQSAITNAFIEGYKVKGKEDKTARELIFSKKTAEKLIPEIDKMVEPVENEFPTIGMFMGLTIRGVDYMPDHLGALVDDEGNILSFIEIEN